MHAEQEMNRNKQEGHAIKMKKQEDQGEKPYKQDEHEKKRKQSEKQEMKSQSKAADREVMTYITYITFVKLFIHGWLRCNGPH